MKDIMGNVMNLHEYDIIIVNSSAGKDSLISLFEINEMAERQHYPKSQIHVSHQDLGEAEWGGTKELVETQAKLFGFQTHYSKRRTQEGKEESLLEYAERRKMWPARNQRWCTSDFKRGPGARVVTKLAPGRTKSKVLYVFGFRAEESPARRKKAAFSVNQKLTTKAGREVFEYLPVHDWSTIKVWEVIKGNNLPYHPAYDLGMPRLSCCFCIFSPFDALVVAGKANPELLDKYIAVEEKIGHTFRDGFSIATVKEAILDGHQPNNINNWVM